MAVVSPPALKDGAPTTANNKVEMWGEDFSRLLLVPVGLLIGLICLPAEVRTVSDCEERRISRRWEWHSALLIWMETLMVAYTVVCLVL